MDLYQWINATLMPLGRAAGIPVQGIKILLSLLFLYPLAVIFSFMFGNKKVSKGNLIVRHTFMATSGLFLCWFCIGSDIKYCLFSSVVTFSIYQGAAFISPLCNSKLARKIRFYFTIFNFLFNFFYLLLLYAWFETNEYDIDVTLVQSLLCLRNISIVIDLYDHNWFFPASSNAGTGQNDAFKTLPGLESFFGYSYCAFTLLVGPSIVYSVYHSIVSDEGTKKPYNVYYKRSMVTFLKSVVYLTVHHFLSIRMPASYALTDHFSRKNLFFKLGYLTIAGKGALMKYFGVWLLVEGATFLGGDAFLLAHDGHHRMGTKLSVSKLQNIKPIQFERSLNFRDTVNSFNIKTNYFGKQYIFKRCISFNQKWLSTVLTLTFLCIWHGFHYGYYHCFLAEFILLFIDENLRICSSNLILGAIFSIIPRFLKFLLLHHLLFVFFVSFELMSFTNTLIVLQSIQFVPVLVVFSGAVFSYLMVRFVRSYNRKAE